jgi:hypothetical protein
MNDELGLAVTFLQDLIEKGLRYDMNPTRHWRHDDPDPRRNEAEWWQNYMTSAEKNVKQASIKCLRDMGHWTATNEKMYGHYLKNSGVFPEHIAGKFPQELEVEPKIKLQLLKYAVSELIQKLEVDKNTSLEEIKNLLEQI